MQSKPLVIAPARHLSREVVATEEGLRQTLFGDHPAAEALGRLAAGTHPAR